MLLENLKAIYLREVTTLQGELVFILMTQVFGKNCQACPTRLAI